MKMSKFLSFSIALNKKGMDYLNAKDYKKAFECFSKAAENGVAYGQHNLGFMYEKGYYVSQDYKKAYMWYYLSQLSGLDNSKELKALENDGWFSSAKVSKADVEQAQDEAQKKYKILTGKRRDLTKEEIIRITTKYGYILPDSASAGFTYGDNKVVGDRY